MANKFKPGTKIPLLEEVKDTGKFVAGILAHTSKPSGQLVYGASGWFTPTDMVSAIERVSGRKTTFTSLSDETFESFLPPNLAKEMSETFSFIDEYAYFGPGAEQLLEESLAVRKLWRNWRAVS